ncbi:hypothetical protein [Streptomyces sp. NBC_00207]|uniref:hypothetical protein n=1 Tax=unclassified Streptomyces TaxID=2593676 RepID=UPI00324C7388
MEWLVRPLHEAGFRVVALDHHGNNFVDGYEPQGSSTCGNGRATPPSSSTRSHGAGQPHPADRRGCRARRLPASAPQPEAPVKAVKAAVDRAGAATTRRLTGTWPG